MAARVPCSACGSYACAVSRLQFCRHTGRARASAPDKAPDPVVPAVPAAPVTRIEPRKATKK